MKTDGLVSYLAQKRCHDTERAPGTQSSSLSDIKDMDFLAIGLGGTNMLAMLWAIATGKRAVGVEMRGDPFLGVHWNIREDMYHQLGLMDEMMLARYGESDLPKKMDGSLFSLADTFYHPSTNSRDVIPDAVAEGYDRDHHMTGRILNVEYIDDRWKDNKPHRTITTAPPPAFPESPDPSKIRTDMHEVLDGPSTWQSGAFYIQLLLRRYLEKIEELDTRTGRPPRARLFTRHRVVQDGSGLVKLPCGRVQVRIEEVTEMDFKGELIRMRTPGSNFIDLGVPELLSIATGVNCSEAERLGFTQHDVSVDHGDGRGSKVAQADFVAAQIEILVDGRLRRRIASELDKFGNEHWVRQIAVGHEGDPRISWLLVEVPDFVSFCPIERGLLNQSTAKDSPEYFAAYQSLLYDFYIEQAGLILELPKHVLRRAGVVYGPKPFSLIERIGDDARLSMNGVAAGDSFGNGHFLHSAGAMCGMIGHAYRFLEYWQRREQGMCAESSIQLLAKRIKKDTEVLLEVSAKEFDQAIPTNFGSERGQKVASASGIDSNKRVTVAEAGGERKRFPQAPLNPTDWRRLFVRHGRIECEELPKLSPLHPLQQQQVAKAML